MVGSESGGILFIGVFFGFLFFIGTLGFGGVSSSNPDAVNPQETSACVNGSNLDCGLNTIGEMGSFVTTDSNVPGINFIVLLPISLLVVWLIIKGLPTT